MLVTLGRAVGVFHPPSDELARDRVPLDRRSEPRAHHTAQKPRSHGRQFSSAADPLEQRLIRGGPRRKRSGYGREQTAPHIERQTEGDRGTRTVRNVDKENAGADLRSAVGFFWRSVTAAEDF